jgi:hypothetical protein
MVRRDNQRGIIQVAENILKRLTKWFVDADTIPATRVYEDDIIAANLDPDLCREILIGMAHLEAPYNVFCEGGSLMLECPYEDGRCDRFAEAMTWVANEEPDLLEAASNAMD